MSLPKSKSAIFEIKIPSTKAKVKANKMKVREEKILLTAKESGEVTDILMAIKQVVNNCIIEPNFDIDQLALFDLEYIFLKLRSASIDNVSKVSYRDSQDDKIYDFDIDLTTVEVKFPENIENFIKVDDDISIELGYPSAALYSDKSIMNLNDGNFIDILLSKCIKRVYEGDKEFNLKDSTNEEIEEFISNLEIPVYDQLKNYFSNLPQMEHIIKYKNSLGNERSIRLSTLDDFFTLG